MFFSNMYACRVMYVDSPGKDTGPSNSLGLAIYLRIKIEIIVEVSKKQPKNRSVRPRPHGFVEGGDVDVELVRRRVECRGMITKGNNRLNTADICIDYGMVTYKLDHVMITCIILTMWVGAASDVKGHIIS